MLSTAHPRRRPQAHSTLLDTTVGCRRSLNLVLDGQLLHAVSAKQREPAVPESSHRPRRSLQIHEPGQPSHPQRMTQHRQGIRQYGHLPGILSALPCPCAVLRRRPTTRCCKPLEDRCNGSKCGLKRLFCGDSVITRHRGSSDAPAEWAPGGGTVEDGQHGRKSRQQQRLPR